MNTKTLVFFLSIFPVLFQCQTMVFGEKEKAKVIENGIEVVLTGEPEADEVLRQIIEEEWTISKYKFLSQSQFDSHEEGDWVFALGNFVGTHKLMVSSETYILRKTEPFFGFIHKFNPKGFYHLGAHASLVSHTIRDYKGLNYNTLLRFEIRKFNNDVLYQTIKEQKARYEPLKTTKILFNELDTIFTLEEIREFYPYDVEIVSQERIESAILNKERILVATIVRRDLETLVQNGEWIYMDVCWADTGEFCFFKRVSYLISQKKHLHIYKKRLLKALLKAANSYKG